MDSVWDSVFSHEVVVCETLTNVQLFEIFDLAGSKCTPHTRSNRMTTDGVRNANLYDFVHGFLRICQDPLEAFRGPGERQKVANPAELCRGDSYFDDDFIR